MLLGIVYASMALLCLAAIVLMLMVPVLHHPLLLLGMVYAGIALLCLAAIILMLIVLCFIIRFCCLAWQRRQNKKTIGLVKCAAITDRSILALAKLKQVGTGGPIERLHLSYCTKIQCYKTDVSVSGANICSPLYASYLCIRC
jgi:hypothetical protein